MISFIFHFLKKKEENIPTISNFGYLIHRTTDLETVQDTITDAVLLAQKGDNQAFGSLYRQFSKAMFNICVRMMGECADAEDILQEAFVKAFHNIHSLKEEKYFGGWLRQITINECLAHLKKTILPTELTEEWDKIEQHEAVEDIANWYEQIEMDELRLYIANLPNGCRQIFVLYAIEDYTHRQIAEALHISEGTSKSQYMRAKNLLKERLTKKILNG